MAIEMGSDQIGLPIGSTRLIGATTSTVESAGQVWLRSGVTESNTGLYPDAFVGSPGGDLVYSGVTQVASFGQGTGGIVWDGTNHWGISSGPITNEAQRNDLNWSNIITGFWYRYRQGTTPQDGTTGFSNDIGTSSAGDACWDGVHFHLIDNTKQRVWECNSATWNTTGAFFDISTQFAVGEAVGITNNDTHFFIINGATGVVHRYDIGTKLYDQVRDLSGDNLTPTGIFWDSFKSVFWVSQGNGNVGNGTVVQYDANFNLTGVTLQINPTGPNLNIIDISTTDGIDYWFHSFNTATAWSEVWKYETSVGGSAVGIPTEILDPVTQHALYMRVK